MSAPPGAFCHERTVLSPEIDLQGRVNNVSFVAWLNDAAIADSFARGFDLAEYARRGTMWVVRRHEVDYHRPAFLGEEIVVHTWIDGWGAATADRQHEVRRRSDDTVLVTAMNVWAWVDAVDGRPRRIPPEVRAAFGTLTSPVGWRRRHGRGGPT